MNEALASLSGTDGVRGVVVFDSSGTCLLNELPPPYEPLFMSDAVKRIFSAVDIFSSLDDGNARSFCLNGEEGGVVLRYINPHVVLALTEPNVNTNVLNVALNVVALKLNRESGARRIPNPSSTMNTFGSQSSHSLTTSGNGEIEIPPDAVDRAVVQQLLQIYKNYMGPAAKAVLKQQLETLGVTSRTLRVSQLGDFISRLSVKLPDAERQAEFNSEANDLRHRSGL